DTGVCRAMSNCGGMDCPHEARWEVLAATNHRQECGGKTPRNCLVRHEKTSALACHACSAYYGGHTARSVNIARADRHLGTSFLVLSQISPWGTSACDAWKHMSQCLEPPGQVACDASAV